MRFRHLALVLLVGCGGKLVASGTDTGGTSGGTGACADNVPQAGNRACVPGAARANQPLSIDIDSTEACLACGATLDPCTVTVAGKVITVGMTTQLCSVDSRVCPAICEVPATTCEIPPLAAGTYTIKVAGEGENALARQLVVTDDAEETSCELVRPPPSVGPFDFTPYAKTCTTVDDCVIVPSLLCRACACEDTPIAKSAQHAYESDFRAATSQCAPQPGGECAPCNARVPACVKGQCTSG